MVDLFAPLFDIIKTNFATDYPNYITSDNQGYPIFQGYQNNYVVPTNGKYVIITQLEDLNWSLNIQPVVTPASITAGTQTYGTIVSTKMQVDFYGNNANNNARVFAMLLDNSYGNDFFDVNDYACSINKVDPVRNLTNIEGRDMYLPRYVVRLSLFNNVTTTIPLQTYDDFDNHFIFVPVGS